MRMNKMTTAVAAWLLGVVGLAWAQTDNIQVHDVTVVVTDRAGRVFDSGTLETTLISAPGYESGQTLGTETVQFSVGEAAKSFPIRDGRADIRLLVQADTSKDPFRYQFAGKTLDGSRFVSKNLDVTPNTRSVTLIAPDRIAPHSSMETVLEIAFLVIAAAVVVWAFFFVWFRRMLFNRRKEVESAAPASAILTLIYLLIAVVIAGAAWEFPGLLSDAVHTYLILCSIFIVLFVLGLFLTFTFSKPAART